MSRTRIVATIGPATRSREALAALARAGMSVARLNGSHADLDWHAATIALIRDVLPDIPILFDVPGRKVRTATLKVEPTFDKGELIVLTTEQGHDGSEKVPVNYAGLHRDVAAGDTILADDGTLRFHVERVQGQDIVVRADMAGQLKSCKGINLPFISLSHGVVTERDRRMIAFTRQHAVDFVGISFVESADHVAAVRDLIGGDSPRIISKVENRGGLAHLEEIIDASDAIMIDRGDLSVETSLDRLALFQKEIIALANRHDTPVIVATEMLHTMIENPYPTKAEVSDITNAVLDGCAATMLSGETAVGTYFAEAVAMMRRVSDVASQHLSARAGEAEAPLADTIPNAVEQAVALICRGLPVTKIVAITRSGYAARKVALRRPRQPVLAVSDDPMAARSFNLLPGTTGVCVDIAFSRDSTDHIVQCLEALWRQSKLALDDLILVTSVGYPRAGNRMNLIQTHYVRDLVATLGWDPNAGGMDMVDIQAVRG
ncbi:MAG: pyruvate kinase [Alphaproteobacteria bacterium]|nr:pyruvate kinase [Alphaproteobacteria bacterium]